MNKRFKGYKEFRDWLAKERPDLSTRGTFRVGDNKFNTPMQVLQFFDEESFEVSLRDEILSENDINVEDILFDVGSELWEKAFEDTESDSYNTGIGSYEFGGQKGVDTGKDVEENYLILTLKNDDIDKFLNTHTDISKEDIVKFLQIYADDVSVFGSAFEDFVSGNDSEFSVEVQGNGDIEVVYTTWSVT